MHVCVCVYLSIHHIYIRYVGQYVANRALRLGLEVTSISRSGPPAHPIDGYATDWVSQVKWEKGTYHYICYTLVICVCEHKQ
jgi:hypothetical protein